MNISDLIAEFINKQLEESDGTAELQRNDLAMKIGCVPSQINYVIASRFTPEQGYTVESRRGGGGFIRITKVRVGRNAFLMHVVNSIGASLDFASAKAICMNLCANGVIDEQTMNVMVAAVSPRNFMMISPQMRNAATAAVLKAMLLALI